MDPKTRDVLEFNLVIDRIAGWATSSLGREYLLAMEPATSAVTIEERTAPLRDLMLIATSSQSRVPLGGLFDPRELLKAARVEGSSLEEEHWPRLGRVMRLISDLVRFREHSREKYPALARMLLDLEVPEDLLRRIERSFDNDGKLRDDASPGLAAARRQLRSGEQRLLRTVNRMTSELNQRGLLQDNFSTVRSGRHVVPVKAGSKGRVAGIVHGGSASGETFYVEPLEIIEATNEVELHREEERRQVFLFLRELTTDLRPWIPMLEAMTAILARLDGLEAMARLSAAKGWNLPLVEEKGTLRLFKAHHPLLQLQPEKNSVPVTILLDRNDRCIVLSGPNAGGKTTMMKTVGLLAALALCGCPVPAAPGSTLPVFSTVLADIGDQQDIEQGISTFSGHMRRIREIWSKAPGGALVLLDELGTGTDPHEGGALALALLEGFADRARLTLTTSHLDPVKTWAEETTGIRNASFSLDGSTGEPTFRLRLDVPGASEALELARRERLPATLLDRARELVGERHLRMGEMLRRIEEREQQLAALTREAEARAKALEEQEQLVRARADLLRDERREMREKRLVEEERAIETVRERIEKLISDLPSVEDLNRRKEMLIRAREEALRERELRGGERRRLAEQLQSAGEFCTGQKVFVASFGQWGEILEIDTPRDRARVLVGRLEAWAATGDLLDHDPGERRSAQRQLSRDIEESITRKGKRKKKFKDIKGALRSANVEESEARERKHSGAVITKSVVRLNTMELDLHGHRVEEALEKLDRFLDKALLSDYPWVRICHGTGTGRLYRAVHEFLKKHPSVKKYRFGTPEEGGGGMTIVEL
ncbi:MAG: Smr/MutS family protein [Candidatus Sumerlaeia bacterium]|nr:Smr/MutS family protein [Candidatus Sumerlaeia bacterium]